MIQSSGLDGVASDSRPRTEGPMQWLRGRCAPVWGCGDAGQHDSRDVEDGSWAGQPAVNGKVREYVQRGGARTKRVLWIGEEKAKWGDG